MRSVPGTDNVIPFRRPAAARQGAINAAFGAGEPPRSRSRSDQRNLMDAVYATGSLRVPAGDRETKLIASRLQVYGFLTIEEMDEDGALRRLRPSEAIRAPRRAALAPVEGELRCEPRGDDPFRR
ncbi:hypothetical protein M2440_003850 [Methylorubrum extorquens]|nr:hypothetical protein [Methylorubrum extorquens]